MLAQHHGRGQHLGLDRISTYEEYAQEDYDQEMDGWCDGAEWDDDNDVMVSSDHSADMARRIPNARLEIYPDSGHGGVFQHHEDFVRLVNEFLDA